MGKVGAVAVRWREAGSWGSGEGIGNVNLVASSYAT